VAGRALSRNVFVTVRGLKEVTVAGRELSPGVFLLE